MLEKNKTIARRFFEELYSEGKVELIEELMAPNYVASGPGSQLQVHQASESRAEGHSAVRKSIKSKPADINVVVEEQVAEGDKVVSRLTFSSGGETWVGVAIQRIVDGKLVETWRQTNRS